MEKEIAAIYCRLSQDDGDLGESGSIQTQKSILTRYCKDNHIAIGEIYSDDGYTGQNCQKVCLSFDGDEELMNHMDEWERMKSGGRDIYCFTKLWIIRENFR